MQIWKFAYFSSEAVARRSSSKKVFLEIPQNAQENMCAVASFLIIIWDSKPFFWKTLRRVRRSF